MEALGVAVLMGGGPSVIYATHVVEALDSSRTEPGRGPIWSWSFLSEARE